MRFAFHGEVSDTLSSFADRLSAALTARGYEKTDDLATANLVCNFVNRDNVRPYRRENKTTFCAAIYEGAAPPADFKEAISDYYPVLVRALSNVSVKPDVHCGWFERAQRRRPRSSVRRRLAAATLGASKKLRSLLPMNDTGKVSFPPVVVVFPLSLGCAEERFRLPRRREQENRD